MANEPGGEFSSSDVYAVNIVRKIAMLSIIKTARTPGVGF